jgi:predicted acetyltransferase
MISSKYIEISPAGLSEKPVLQQMLELYQYDFSEFDAADIEPSGAYGYPYLDKYWIEPGRTPFLIRVNGNLAGFVLVARYDYISGLHDDWVVSEFFIMRKYRHNGVGEYVARYIFDQFPGNWQVGQITENLPAIEFWHKVIERYTNGNFQEYILDNDHWHGPVQVFASLPK